MRNFLRDSRGHLHNVRATYLEHAKTALMFSGQCFKAAAMAFAHSLVPGIFQTSAGDTVRRLLHEMESQKRNHRDADRE